VTWHKVARERLVACLAMALLAIAPSATLAGEASAATISLVHFMSDGGAIFYISSTHTNVPACASSNPNRFLIAGGTPGTKSQIAGLLSAYLQGKQIVVTGTGTCPGWGSESVDYFYIAT